MNNLWCALPRNATQQWKEWTIDTHSNLDESPGNWGEWEKQIIYCMITLTQNFGNHKNFKMIADEW